MSDSFFRSHISFFRSHIRSSLIHIIVSEEKDAYVTIDDFLLFATHSSTESQEKWVHIRLRVRGPTYDQPAQEWALKRPVEEPVLQEMIDFIENLWSAQKVQES